jgi:hypothetical protein
MPVILEAMERQLGEGDPNKIQVLGASVEETMGALKKRGVVNAKRKKKTEK